WQAPSSGTAVFSTRGSNFDTLLAVYTGSNVGALTAVTSNDNDPSGGTQSRVSFAAGSRIFYYIAVDGFGGGDGRIRLNWNPPANDEFSTAQTITGAFGTVLGTNLGATKEIGEPDHSSITGGASVWYRWVPAANGTATFTTKRSNFPTLLAVYTGQNVST